MSEDLKMRVEQFRLMKLPGQPQMMHMGTSYLINDLYAEIQRLQNEGRWVARVVELERSIDLVRKAINNGT